MHNPTGHTPHKCAQGHNLDGKFTEPTRFINSSLNMDKENEIKHRRPRRSKADIEDAIHKAAVTQIKKKGFSMALVTDIVKRAKIEPIVFYNRYKNLNEFYDSFVKQYDYWLSDLIRANASGVDTQQGFVDIFNQLVDKLAGDEIMVELLRWEISEGNHITERTARLRELHSIELINQHKDKYTENSGIVPLIALIVGGIYFMVMHKDRSTFGGIDINTPDGRQALANAFDTFGEMVFKHHTTPTAETIAERMRAEGIADDVIARCIAPR